MANHPLRNIPSVSELLESPPLRGLVDRVSHNVVVSGVRSFLDSMRQDVQSATADMKVPSPGELAQRIADWIAKDETATLRPVINATGIILHTGLGRAPLAQEAIQAMADVAAGYSSLEVDLETGERSQRVLSVSKLLRQMTGAEAATVANNNAAATLLTLSSLAKGREVIVSRGQLIEIGGSYRLPDVMAMSGARLKEVGTTNKTYLRDFEEAVTEATGALLNVHTSNYRVVGFTQEVALADLVQLGHQHKLPVIDDIGSGALIDMSPYGVLDEPLAAESLRTGADITLFSGDKLLGGPQCGVMVGRKALIRQIMKNPLMRAVRVDKTVLAALAATLRIYRDVKVAEGSIPILALLSTSVANLQNRAERLAPQLAAAKVVESAEPIESTTYLGGGSVPAQAIPTWCVAIAPARSTVDALAASLRSGSTSVFGRVQQDRLLLDLRTVFPHQDSLLVQALESVEPEKVSKANENESLPVRA
ncbi:MAG: L-seryl-tRNA(Sec) selenium transferase [Pirellulaceae bacterium]